MGAALSQEPRTRDGLRASDEAGRPGTSAAPDGTVEPPEVAAFDRPFQLEPSDKPLCDLLGDEIEGTVKRLTAKKFEPDPIAGEYFSRITSVMSSAYKRHGNILELAILHQLKKCPRLIVWNEPKFRVSPIAVHIASGALKNPASALGNQVTYGEGTGTLQVDAIVYDKETKSLSAYEIKRGFGVHDAGKKRQILTDILCLNLLLKSYGEKRGLEVKETSARVIFYYGKRSIAPSLSLTGKQLDEHFGWPIVEAVEQVNDLFRRRLFDILSK